MKMVLIRSYRGFGFILTFFVWLAFLNSFSYAQCDYSLETELQGPTCYNDDGWISIINLSGPVAPYTYEWSHGATMQNVDGLAPGFYTVTITDSNGCEVIFSESISFPEPLSIWFQIDTFYGNWNIYPNSSLLSASPLSYAWSNGATDEFLINVPDEEYCLTIMDAVGCTGSGCIYPTGVTFETPLFSAEYVPSGNYFEVVPDSAHVAFYNGQPGCIWTFGDGDTSNLQYPTHTYSSNDIYVVCLRMGGFGYLTPTYCRPLGFDSFGNPVTRTDGDGFSIKVVPRKSEYHISNDIVKIFPVPLDGTSTLFFHSPKEASFDFKIKSALGQTVFHGNHKANAGDNFVEFSTETLSPGWYILTLLSGEKLHSLTFTK